MQCYAKRAAHLTFATSGLSALLQVVLLVWAVQWEVPHVDLVQREPTAKKAGN